MDTRDQYILALVHPTCNVFLFGGDREYHFLFDVKKENITCKLILYDVNFFISHLFDVEKGNIASRVSESQYVYWSLVGRLC